MIHPYYIFYIGAILLGATITFYVAKDKTDKPIAASMLAFFVSFAVPFGAFIVAAFWSFKSTPNQHS